jgi:hypothetical protein
MVEPPAAPEPRICADGEKADARRRTCAPQVDARRSLILPGAVLDGLRQWPRFSRRPAPTPEVAGVTALVAAMTLE